MTYGERPDVGRELAPRVNPARLDVDVIRNQFAPEATDAELEHFALVCRHLELDPYAEQIVLIGRRTRLRDEHGRDQGWRKVHRPQITVAGRRTIAARTGRLRGIDGPQWCGPRVDGPDGQRGPLEWLEVWDDDDTPPYAARCRVWPDGWTVPANGTAKWSEFAQYVDANMARLSPFWKRSPSHMLGKVAESLALRRAFPEVDAALGFADPPRGLERDDAAIVAEAEAADRREQIRATEAAPRGTGRPDASAPAEASVARHPANGERFTRATPVVDYATGAIVGVPDDDDDDDGPGALDLGPDPFDGE